MSPLEYVTTALDDWRAYLVFLVVSAVLHWTLLLRRRTLGFFDPLFFVLFGSVFGWALVWFMYWRGDIRGLYAASFTVAELAFYAGLASTKMPAPRHADVRSEERPGFAISVFVAAGAMHVATTLATWSIAGIPLFRTSRLGAFVDSGGFGVLERLVDSSGAIALFACAYLVFGNARVRSRLIYYAFLAWYLASIVLSGSKSALLIFGQVVFAVAFLYTDLPRQKDSFWGGRYGKQLVVAATLFALLVLFVQPDTDLLSALQALAFRLLSFGDIYIYAYPNDAVESLTGSNPLVGLFGGVLSTFRLFPVSDLYVHAGYQFTLLTFPDIDYVTGPNPRHPVIGYHYFGAFAFLFSFVLGVLTSSLQRALYAARRRRTFLGALLAYLAYAALVDISVDFDYALSKIANAVIALMLILPIAFLLFPHHPVHRLRVKPVPAAP